jgi:Flp pilus assembly pilin Flp
MKIFNLTQSFARDEDGAVTVDWVVLTAAIVGLGIAMLTVVGDATDDYADSIGNHLSSMGIKTTYGN